MQPADPDAAEAILDQMLDKSTQIHWTRLNWTFHHAFYRAADRPQTLDILEKLYMNAYRHFPVPMRFTIGSEAMDAEHRRILKPCREGNAAEAQAFLKDRIMRGSVSLVERLQRAEPQD